MTIPITIGKFCPLTFLIRLIENFLDVASPLNPCSFYHLSPTKPPSHNSTMSDDKILSDTPSSPLSTALEASSATGGYASYISDIGDGAGGAAMQGVR